MHQLTSTQQAILHAIAQGHQAASDIANHTNISLPYIGSQLQLLEAQGWVEASKKRSTKSVGKPKTLFHMCKEHTSVSLIRPHRLCEMTISNTCVQTILEIMSFFPSEAHEPLNQYFWLHKERIKQVIAWAKGTYTQKHIELLAIAPQEAIEHLRKTISDVLVSNAQGDTVKISCWVHTHKEIQEGCANNDEYYKKIVSRMKTIIDPQKQLKQLGVMYE